MGTIICLMGKSCSGKDTIYRKLLEDGDIDAEALVPYTTRPIRAKETDGTEYHFVNEDDYSALKANGDILEERAYRTVYGLWRYFTVLDRRKFEAENKTYLYIGTLEAYVSFAEALGSEAILPIYVETDDGIRLERALKRERKQAKPKYAEMCRRFLADTDDFSEDKLEASGILAENRFSNNEELDACLTQVKEYICAQLRRR